MHKGEQPEMREIKYGVSAIYFTSLRVCAYRPSQNDIDGSRLSFAQLLPDIRFPNHRFFESSFLFKESQLGRCFWSLDIMISETLLLCFMLQMHALDRVWLAAQLSINIIEQGFHSVTLRLLDPWREPDKLL